MWETRLFMALKLTGLEIWACEWDDAHYNGGEFTLHEIEHRPVTYITTGILIRDDDVGVMLSNDICETGSYRGLNFIPRKMVLRTWRVGPLQKRASNPRNQLKSKDSQKMQVSSHSISNKQSNEPD